MATDAQELALVTAQTYNRLVTFLHKIENLADFNQMCHDVWIENRLDPQEILVSPMVAITLMHDVLTGPMMKYVSPGAMMSATGFGIEYIVNRVTGSQVYLNYPGKPPRIDDTLPQNWIALVVDEYE
jgi:hypothetical protein